MISWLPLPPWKSQFTLAFVKIHSLNKPKSPPKPSWQTAMTTETARNLKRSMSPFTALKLVRLLLQTKRSPPTSPSRVFQRTGNVPFPASTQHSSAISESENAKQETRESRDVSALNYHPFVNICTYFIIVLLISWRADTPHVAY